MSKPTFYDMHVDLNSTTPRMMTRHTLEITDIDDKLINEFLHVVVETWDEEDPNTPPQWEWEEESVELWEICELFDCTPDELLEWVKSQPQVVIKDGAENGRI